MMRKWFRQGGGVVLVVVLGLARTAAAEGPPAPGSEPPLSDRAVQALVSDCLKDGGARRDVPPPAAPGPESLTEPGRPLFPWGGETRPLFTTRVHGWVDVSYQMFRAGR